MSHVADAAIVAEDEADRRRVIEERHLAEYVAVVKQSRAEARAAREAVDRESYEEDSRDARNALVKALHDELTIPVLFDDTHIYFLPTDEHDEPWRETFDDPKWYPVVMYANLMLALPSYNSSRLEWRQRNYPAVGRICSVCRQDMWVTVRSPLALVEALEKDHQHVFACLERDVDEYPVEPETNSVTAAGQHKLALEAYAFAVTARRTAQFNLAKEKEHATTRIRLAGGVEHNGEKLVANSTTAAEKLVEFDAEYVLAYHALTIEVTAEIRCREKLYIARAAALGESRDGAEVNVERYER